MKIYVARLFLCLILCFGALPNYAQTSINEGVVHFVRTTNWVQIRNKLPFLSQEEKDRALLSWGNEAYSEYYQLLFSANKSIYLEDEEAKAAAATEVQNWSSRKVPFAYYRDFEAQKAVNVETTLGKLYIMQDSIRPVKWRIENQIKDVAGYICMKATTTDPVTNFKIAAWFAQDLTLQAGPERYSGLPGMILELDINEGDVIVAASKVEQKNIAAELKVPSAKGKKIDQQGFDTIIKEHIKSSIKAQRNPYWSIRY